MVQDPKKWSQLLCTAWCTYQHWQHWSPGPKLPWKRWYHQLQIGLGHLVANNLTHTQISEKSIEKWLREVAVYNQRVGTSTYFSPHLRVGFFFLALHLPLLLLLLLLLRPSAHHIASIIQITIAQTSRHPPYHASSHQQYHQDIITPYPYHTDKTWHRDNTNHYHTDITTPSVSRIITPALSPRHHHTPYHTISHHDLSWCAQCHFGARDGFAWQAQHLVHLAAVSCGRHGTS